MYEHIYRALLTIHLAGLSGVSAATLSKRDMIELDAAGMIRRHGDTVILHEDGVEALRSEAENRGELARLAEEA